MTRRRILIVDDEAAVVDPIKRWLEDSGSYEVRLESSCAGALPAARSFRPDLVLLDVLLPDGDGGEVAEALRAERELAAVPVLFMTGAVRKDEVRGGRIGGRPFLAKPFSMDELRRALEKLLRAR